MLYEDFIQKLNETNSNVIVVEKFENIKTDEKIQVQCKICGYVWKTSPKMLLYSKTGCIQCFNKNKRGKSRTMTHEQYVEKLSSVNSNITTVGTYIDTKHKIKVRCEVCGNEWDANSADLLKGHGCAKCYDKRRGQTLLTKHDDFIERMSIINPNVEILGQYTRSKDKIKWRCKLCNQEHYDTTAGALLMGQGCKDCSFKAAVWMTTSEFIKQLENRGSDWIVLGEYYRHKVPINCECKKCGYQTKIKPSALMKNKRCPCCTNQIVEKGYNDISTTHPHLVKYFKNPEDAYINYATSSKKVTVKCPDCGYIRDAQIKYITQNGFSCPQCSDKISYPNKFSRSLLNQLPVENLIYEYNPKWAERRKYDNYFEYQGQAYILEMDGGLHYRFNNRSKQTAEEVQEIDRIKDELANSHNITVIRIECQKSEMNYIRDNILQSQLATILDLSIVDWNKCDLDAQSNLVKAVCDRYTELMNTSIDLYDSVLSVLHSEFKLSLGTISIYLSKGSSLGMCDYSPAKTKHSASIRLAKIRFKPVEVYDNNKCLLGAYKNIQDCVNALNKISNYNYTNVDVLKSCVLEQQDTSGLYFKFIS